MCKSTYYFNIIKIRKRFRLFALKNASICMG